MARTTPKRRNIFRRSTPRRRPRAFGRAAGLVGLAVLGAWAADQPVRANPQGGTVVGGAATITGGPGRLDIEQQSDKAIIDWRGFSIGAGEATAFHQPGQGSVALNRVTGIDPSAILGSLRANGHIFLVNPNGILFGPGSRIDVGGLIATTSDIANQDFLAARYLFDRPSPNPNAMVVNRGTITVAERGLAALVAPGVENSGVIRANLGRVTLAGAETFTLDLTGDGLLAFGVGSAVGEAPVGADALVVNSGVISAEGGSVLLTADMAAGVLSNAINMSGVIEARSARVDRTGAIVLSGGANGLVAVSGTLDASGAGAGMTGGTVDVLGDLVALRDGGRIDVSGDAGGGTVRVGGDYQGKGAVPTARRTLIEDGAVIAADALGAGGGGRVIVWADEATRFDGKITARGGPAGGAGGFVETSGKDVLQVYSGTVDASASNGAPGTWLLDPVTATIVGVSSGPVGLDVLFADLTGLDVEILASSFAPFGPGQTAIVQAQELIEVESGADVTTAGGNIVFQSGGDIDIFAAITSNGGNIHFEADSPHTPADVSIPAGSDGVGTLTIDDVNVISGDGDITLIAADFSITFVSNIDAGAGDIFVSITSDQTLNIGPSGELSFGEVNTLQTTGTLTFGRAQSAGSNGLGLDSVPVSAASIFIFDPVAKPNVGALVFQTPGDILTVDPVATLGGGIVFQAGGDISLNSSVSSGGGGVIIEADSPHALPDPDNPGGGSDGSGTLTLEIPNDSDGGSINTGGGDLTMIAADFELDTGLFGDPADAGTGNVNVATTNGLPLALGAPGASGPPDLTGDELDNIVTTGVLTLGRATTAGSDGLGTDAQVVTSGPLTLEGDVSKPDVAALVLVSNNSVTRTGFFDVVTDRLAVIAGGPVDLFGTVDTLAISAPGQTVDFLSFGPVNVGSVAGVTGIQAQNMDLDAVSVTFLVDHTVPAGGVHQVSSSDGDIVFQGLVDGPGSLFVASVGDTTFAQAVGGTSPLDVFVIGDAFPPSVFDALSSGGIEAASELIYNTGNDARFDGPVRAGTLIVKVGNVTTNDPDPANALDVGALLVSGDGASLFGGVAGDFSAQTAASRAFSDPRRFPTDGPDIVEPIVPENFTLNGCVIETLCPGPVDPGPGDPLTPPSDSFPPITGPSTPGPVDDAPVVPPVDAPSRLRVGPEEVLPILPQLIEPTLRFTEIFVPVTEQRGGGDERFSNLGNEEIW